MQRIKGGHHPIAAENNGLDLDAFLKELNRNTGE
jgi:hypothetical protein